MINDSSGIADHFCVSNLSILGLTTGIVLLRELDAFISGISTSMAFHIPWAKSTSAKWLVLMVLGPKDTGGIEEPENTDGPKMGGPQMGGIEVPWDTLEIEMKLLIPS